jgi:xanthine dehydrogenase accessory factor
MALTADGNMAGSVSGGCVETAVIETGLNTLDSGTTELIEFQVSDEQAWNVGLSCGGGISVFVQPLLWDWFAIVEQELTSRTPIALVTVIQGPKERCGHQWVFSPEEKLFGPGESQYKQLEHYIEKIARSALEGERAEICNFSLEALELQFFVEAILPPPVLVMVGGVHISQSLTSLAKTLGYETVVIDPRKAFGDPNRFSNVDRLMQAWPQECLDKISLNNNTAVAVLTHDPKIDDPALVYVLSSEVFYIGVLGSRKTQEERRTRLLDAGVKPGEIKRVHAPIGLSLGGNTPEEIALAIMAEIVQTRNQSLANRRHYISSDINET